jgi:hypothetical protein
MGADGKRERREDLVVYGDGPWDHQELAIFHDL